MTAGRASSPLLSAADSHIASTTPNVRIRSYGDGMATHWTLGCVA
ncbi:hypothetical protein [Terrabacter sp. Soil811]|nr:hypothetical protein [Terrabacter sp. Soil811]